jgi:hypothetical protein
VFILRLPLTVPRLDISSSSSFDPSKGFTITNNTDHNVYLETPASDFVKIEPGNASAHQKEYGSYPVRNNDDDNAPAYLTVNVSSSDGSFKIEPGTVNGELVVTTNFK